MNLKIISLLLLFFTLVACEKNNQNTTSKTASKEAPQVAAFTTIDWDNLIAASHSEETIIAKYQKQLDSLEEDSPELGELYSKIYSELDNAPLNKTLHNKWIKISGFIAPLSYHNGNITEFLLVPYFGACIHVPAPPVNQTVLVKTASDKGIKLEDSFEPVWVSGQIQLEGKKTDIGTAGYSIKEANIELYTEEQIGL